MTTPLDEAEAGFAAATGASTETIEKLRIYRRLLLEANRGLALIGKSTEGAMWDRHFLDSAQLVPLLDDGMVLDVGSGAGLPGLVLAIMGVALVELVENNQQKVAFLGRVVAQLGLAVPIHHRKVEALEPRHAATVTARALAPLSTLISLVLPQIKRGGQLLLLKGRAAESEIEVAQRVYDFDLESIPSRTDATARILRLTRVDRR